jgi:hypothetical protein
MAAKSRIPSYAAWEGVRGTTHTRTRACSLQSVVRVLPCWLRLPMKPVVKRQLAGLEAIEVQLDRR